MWRFGERETRGCFVMAKIRRLTFVERKVERELAAIATFELCYCVSSECGSHLAIDCLRSDCSCAVVGCTRDGAGLLIGANPFFEYNGGVDFGKREYEKLLRRRSAIVRGFTENV